jgi:amino acid transporter
MAETHVLGESTAEKKKISLMGAIFISIGSMVGAGIFALFGQAGEIAGAAVWVSFFAGGVIALLLGLFGSYWQRLGNVAQA